MSSAIAPVQNRALAIEKSDDQYIRDHFAPGLDDRDWEMLQAEAKERSLSIVKREIQAFKFEGKNGKVTIFPTLAGVRRIASETGKLDGSEGPYWCGPDGKWVEVWNSQTPPVAAKFILYIKGRSHPVVAVANWNEAKGEHKEYVNDRPTNKMALNAIWKKMPALMLGKTAEVHALRRSGLIGDETVWTEDDDEVGGQTVRVVENQRDTANRNLHKAVVDAQLGGHAQARALTAAVNPGITSLTQASAADMNEAAGIARSMPGYAQELIDGTSHLSDPPTAVVSEPIDGERAEWRYHVEAEFAIADDPRAIASQFLKEAKADPWRFPDLIELSPNKAFADRFRNAALTAGVDGQIVHAAFKRWEDKQQISDQALKDTPLAELAVSTWDELNKALKLRGMAYAEFADIVGAGNQYASAQAALDFYNERMAALEIPATDDPRVDDFGDVDPETGEILDGQMSFSGPDPARHTK